MFYCPSFSEIYYYFESDNHQQIQEFLSLSGACQLCKSLGNQLKDLCSHRKDLHYFLLYKRFIQKYLDIRLLLKCPDSLNRNSMLQIIKYKVSLICLNWRDFSTTWFVFQGFSHSFLINLEESPSYSKILGRKYLETLQYFGVRKDIFSI